jgi:glycyl-tRNA synthetase
MSAVDKIKTLISNQGALVKQLKALNTPKNKIDVEVEKLISLKEQLRKLEISSKSSFDKQAFEDLLKRRFFYTPSFQLYGGISGLYDYGPSGCALQTNILDLWRKHFILEEDMLELDCTILTPHEVLKTSGHVDRFADLMCKDEKNGDIYRVDHLVEEQLEKRIAENYH